MSTSGKRSSRGTDEVVCDVVSMRFSVYVGGTRIDSHAIGYGADYTDISAITRKYPYRAVTL